jgi:hypothetical protein
MDNVVVRGGCDDTIVHFSLPFRRLLSFLLYKRCSRLSAIICIVQKKSSIFCHRDRVLTLGSKHPPLRLYSRQLHHFLSDYIWIKTEGISISRARSCLNDSEIVRKVVEMVMIVSFGMRFVLSVLDNFYPNR